MESYSYKGTWQPSRQENSMAEMIEGWMLMNTPFEEIEWHEINNEGYLFWAVTPYEMYPNQEGDCEIIVIATYGNRVYVQAAGQTIEIVKELPFTVWSDSL